MVKTKMMIDNQSVLDSGLWAAEACRRQEFFAVVDG